MTRPGGPAAPPGPNEVVFECPACGLVQGRMHDLHALNAALAEREAQIATLREVMARALESARYVLESGSAIRLDRERVVRDLENGLTSTADAAARCVARARQEGAEEMRERCVVLIEAAAEVATQELRHAVSDAAGCVADGKCRALRDLVAAIRALDAGDPAARRG